MKFSITKESNANPSSFRIASIIGKFDLQSAKTVEQFDGDIPVENHDWSVGVIYGNSGTGKSTIAQQLFPDSYIRAFQYERSSVLEDMPEGFNVDEIVQTFNSVGFSSPPSWLKPYEVLSNGEKMRVDLARAIMENRSPIVFDEFTSVVDRNVAKIASYALQKAIRKQGKKFIAVSCHEDVIEWLEPDWVFNTNTMTFFLLQNIPDQKLNLRLLNAGLRSGKCLGVITI